MVRSGQKPKQIRSGGEHLVRILGQNLSHRLSDSIIGQAMGMGNPAMINLLSPFRIVVRSLFDNVKLFSDNGN